MRRGMLQEMWIQVDNIGGDETAFSRRVCETHPPDLDIKQRLHVLVDLLRGILAAAETTELSLDDGLCQRFPGTAIRRASHDQNIYSFVVSKEVEHPAFVVIEANQPRGPRMLMASFQQFQAGSAASPMPERPAVLPDDEWARQVAALTTKDELSNSLEMLRSRYPTEAGEGGLNIAALWGKYDEGEAGHLETTQFMKLVEELRTSVLQSTARGLATRLEAAICAADGEIPSMALAGVHVELSQLVIYASSFNWTAASILLLLRAVDWSHAEHKESERPETPLLCVTKERFARALHAVW